jgi:hypothetical protein
MELINNEILFEGVKMAELSNTPPISDVDLKFLPVKRKRKLLKVILELLDNSNGKKVVLSIQCKKSRVNRFFFEIRKTSDDDTFVVILSSMTPFSEKSNELV